MAARPGSRFAETKACTAHAVDWVSEPWPLVNSKPPLSFCSQRR